MSEAVFIKPMLGRQERQATESLDDGKWIAEPKLDGHRAQVHVRGHRTIAIYSRLEHNVMDQPGLARWRDLVWPVDKAVLDAEMFSGAGLLNELSVLSTRATEGGDGVDLAVFDLLSWRGESVMGAAIENRRFMLEAMFRGAEIPGLAVVEQTKDWHGLWKTWVEGRGGEGLMLKRIGSPYEPGKRSPYWIKVKKHRMVDVVITGVTEKATYTTGGYRTGEVGLTYGYWDPATDGYVTVGQGLRVGPRQEMEAMIGRVAEVKCHGILKSGALRDNQLIRFRDDKRSEDCTREAA